MKGLIFTYAMTCGGSVLAFVNPFIGLLVYICFAIIRPQSMWPWSVPEGNYSRIVAICLLLGWLVRGCGDWQIGRSRGVVVALVCFWFWGTLGAAMAPVQDLSLRFVEQVGKIVLPFVVGITCIGSVRQIKQLAWVIVLSEGYVAFEFNVSYYQGYNRLWEEGFGGMDNNCVAVAMVACLGMAFFLGLRAHYWWQKALAFGAAACMVHVVLFSYSRGGMLGVIVTSVMIFLLIPKNPKYYLYFALAVMLSLRLAGEDTRARFSTILVDKSERDSSAQSRLDLWASCLEVMGRHPVFGVGPIHWPSVATMEFGWAKPKEAHTLWLQTGAELGFPGLGCLLSFYGLCIIRLWPLAREKVPSSDPWFQDAARMVIAALVGFVVCVQFVSVEELEEPYYIALIGAGVLKLASQKALDLRTQRRFADTYNARMTYFRSS